MLTSGILDTVCAAALFSVSSFAIAVKRDATPTSGTLSLTFSSYIGDATPTNIHYVTMDGGGGGVLNRHNVAIFSDTTTKNGDGSDAKMRSGGFISNSAYYIPDTSNPLAMGGFETDGVPNLAVPWFDDECPNPDDCDWWMWPNSAFATQNNLATDTVGYGVYDTGKRPYDWQYKTLAKLEANDDGLTVTRPVQAYITSNSIHRWGWSVASDGDGYVHIFAKGGSNSDGTTNLYAAKVPFNEIEDTSKFLYYNGDHYALNSEADAVPVAAGYLSSGDVFYSEHYSTWIIVSMGGGDAIDYIYVQYSTTGMARGPYSPPQTVLPKTSVTENSFNYDLHSYPKFFGTTSQDLLVSWSYDNGTIIKMGKLSFDP